MEELNVGNIIISKQGEDSENYQKFKEIVNEKKINVVVVGINSNYKNMTTDEKTYMKTINIERDLS